MTCHTPEGLTDFAAVSGQVVIQTVLLLLRPLIVRRIGTSRPAFDHYHTVHGIHRLICDHGYGLLDAYKKLIQLILCILTDQAHHLNGFAVGFSLEQRITDRNNTQSCRENHANGKCC